MPACLDGAGTTVHRLEEQLSVDSGNDMRRAHTRSTRNNVSSKSTTKRTPADGEKKGQSKLRVRYLIYTLWF